MLIRPINPSTEFPAVVALLNTFEKDPVTVEQFSQWFYMDIPGRILRRRVAVDDREQVLGYSLILHEKWHVDGLFYVWLAVAPEAQRIGIGEALYQDVLRFVLGNGATLLTSEIREDFPDAIRFAEKHGFSIERHLYESTLDLESFDLSQWRAAVERVEAQGIHFVTLADFNDSQEARRKLYEVNYITSLETPGYDGDWMPFDEFEQHICGAEWYRPSGQMGAVLGEQWVGMAAVRLIPESGGAYNLMTGVLKEYRGRGIAQALKVKAIDYAKKNGAKYIRTHNNSKNLPMLAVNRKLGYLPQPGVFEVRREWKIDSLRSETKGVKL